MDQFSNKLCTQALFLVCHGSTNCVGSSWCCASRTPLPHQRGSRKPGDQPENGAGGTGDIAGDPWHHLLCVLSCRLAGGGSPIVLPDHQDSGRTEVGSRFCCRCFTANEHHVTHLLLEPTECHTISHPQASFPGSSSIPLSPEQCTEVSAMPHLGRA